MKVLNMIAALARISCSAILFAAAHAAGAFEPRPEEETQVAEAEIQADEETGTAEKSSEATEAERVCRYIKLDMSSRRKTKVCRTVEEWNALNNRR